MKKILPAILALLLSVALICGCNSKKGEDPLQANLSADGYVKGKISDFSVYEGTDAYRKVTTADELLQAIVDAKYHYKNVWDENTNT